MSTCSHCGSSKFNKKIFVWVCARCSTLTLIDPQPEDVYFEEIIEELAPGRGIELINEALKGGDCGKA